MARRIKTYSIKRISILVVTLVLGFILIYKWNIIGSSFEFFLRNHQNYIVYILPLAIILGLVHAYYGNAEEHTLFLFKYLGPILASPLTCLTYAIVINSSLALLYIICYDTQTLIRYTTIDKTTLSYTLLLLLSWSVFGLVKIIMDIVTLKPKENLGEVTTVAQVVNEKEAYELNYWAQQLEVSPDQLLVAISKVGNSIEALKDYLKK